MARFDFKTRTGQISAIIQSGFDEDVKAFFNRVIAAGGTLTSIEQSAINNLVIDMKSSNIWDNMKAIYPMVGSSAAACAQNLKSSNFTATFTSGWTFASTGVTGNGTSAFMNTLLNQSSNLNISNNHVSVYSRSNVDSSSQADTGISDNLTYSVNIMYSRYSNNFRYENGSQNSLVFANTNSQGHFIGTSTSSTSAKTYKNGSIAATNTSTQTRSLFNNNLVFGACMISTSNTPLFFSTRQYAFASIGDGLTDTQAFNFYTAIQQFQTTLGRQV